jgi:hypothetical protein
MNPSRELTGNKRRTAMKAALWASFTLALAGVSSSTVTPVPPTDKSIEGCWVGLPYEASDFCRLILTNYHGVFARAYPAEKPMVYLVDSYHVGSGGRIEIKVSTASSNSYPILLTGTATHNEIRLTVKSPDGGWSHASLLYREDAVERTLDELRKAMQPPERSPKHSSSH